MEYLCKSGLCAHIFCMWFCRNHVFFLVKVSDYLFCISIFSYCCLDFILRLFQLDRHNWVSPLCLNIFGVFTFWQNSASINMV